MPTPYVTFDGTCGAAFAFYEQVLGATPVSRFTYGESPMAKDVPPALHGLVMHGTITINGQALMGSDAGPWAPFEGPVRSCALSLSYPTADELLGRHFALRHRTREVLDRCGSHVGRRGGGWGRSRDRHA